MSDHHTCINTSMPGPNGELPPPCKACQLPTLTLGPIFTTELGELTFPIVRFRTPEEFIQKINEAPHYGTCECPGCYARRRGEL